MDNNNGASVGACNYKNGTLPSCAPLSVGYVPFQQTSPVKYDCAEALPKGTLFPGLDLPFMNVSNKKTPYDGTPLGELMAIDFAIKELNLYLDTHSGDKEALTMLKNLIALSKEARSKYVKEHGPIMLADLEKMDSYKWINDPWPWDYKGEVND